MKLIAIHLQGFKSFAARTDIPLESALNGIVGPNGCGKSNVIDAVRWVLGENASRQLRAQQAQDVIFAGSENRRPGQQAAVELIFQQDTERLEAFAELEHISIGRRISRDGQSIYQINQKPVRRRDVVSLLHLMGVSARSYAVIEQGMIGRIIDAKPEELRGFIEEAAGIALYKSRRRESEQKLTEVEQHLRRHDERLQDLSARREQLAAEAALAQRFQALSAEQDSLSHRLRSFQFHQLQLSLGQLQRELQDSQSQLQSLENSDQLQRLQRQQEALQAARDAQRQAKKQHLHALQQRQQQQRELEQGQLRLEMNQRQQAEIQENLAQLKAESEAKSALVQDGERQIKDLEQSIQSFGPQLLRLQQEQQRAQQARQREQLLQQQRQQNRQQQALQEQRLRQESQRLQADIQRWQERLQEALPWAEEPETENLEEALWLWESQRLWQEEQQQAQQEEEAAAEDALQRARQQRQEHSQRLEHARGQWATLQKILPAERDELAELPRLWVQLEIDAAWQAGLERHLGAVLQSAYSSNAADWSRAQQTQISLMGAAPIPSAWRDIIHGTADLRPFLAGLQPLPQNSAEVQREALPAGQIFLCLDGVMCSRDSLHFPPPQAQHMQQWRDYQRIKEQLPQLEEALEQSQTAEEQAARRLAEALQAGQALRQQRTDWQQQGQRLQQQRQWQAEQQRQREALRAQWQQQQKLLRQDIERAAQQREELLEALLLLEEEKLMQEEAAPSALDEDWLRRSEQAWQEAEQQQQERQRQLLRLQTQREHHLEQLQRLQLEKHKQQQKQENWQREALHWRAQQEEGQWKLEACSLAVQQQEEQLQQREEALQEAERQQREAERLWQNLQQQQKLLQERIQLQGSQLEQLQQQSQVYAVEFQEMAQPPLSFAADASLDTAQLQAELRQLKQALQNLGAVNLGAIQDLQYIETEHQHWQAQCEDLRQSVALLQQAIQQLDGETRQRLETTFAAVNQAFGEHIARLFSGGQGHLSWDGADVLQAGISIHVRLTGKKMRHLAALSGGEKALSALSLVFALFRLQPAPFCLLDEVDAPLDAANVQRLASLLQEMSRRTQLLVITHHPQTMRHCERLLGVTMSEPGVSRLVGVDLRQEAL